MGPLRETREERCGSYCPFVRFDNGELLMFENVFCLLFGVDLRCIEMVDLFL